MVDVKEIIKDFETKEDVEKFIEELRKAAKHLPSIRTIKIPHRGKRIEVKVIEYEKLPYMVLNDIIKVLGKAMYEIKECSIIAKEGDITIKVKGLRKVILDSVIYNAENSIQEVEVKDIDVDIHDNRYPVPKPIISVEPFEFEGDYTRLQEKRVKMLVDKYELVPVN